MIRGSLRFVLAATVALSGCSALLDVKDIYFDPNAVGPGNPDGSTEGGTTSEGGAGDGGADGAACGADISKDPNHCGRCGHSCFGGACTAGKCQAVELGTIPDAPMNNVVVSDSHVFASTRITLTTQVGGVWRVAKSGGMNPELYVPITYAEQMAVVGDKLYFVVDDDPANGNDKFGGLYSCPLMGAAPCTPTLIAAATLPRSITVDKNRIFYGDDAPGKGLMVYTPPAAPTLFRKDFGFPANVFVDGNVAYYSATIYSNPQRAKVFEALTDGGVLEEYAYESPTADDGRLVGGPTSLLFTAYDFSMTTGGVVRRIPRNAGAAPCNLGGTGNKRPYGIYADNSRVYWANQGEGAAEPFTNGSIVNCEQAGCCTTPEVMWTGNGQPTGVTGDADVIYFVTYGKGSIWKIAKP